MRKNLLYPIIATLILSAVAGCNSSTEDEYEYVQSSSAIVSGFSLKENKKVLDSLQNVFFSIDLLSGRIFNADSLPYGTKVNRLVPNITTATYASEVTLTYYCPETSRDSVVNFLTNPSDSIDFSAGPVKLRVTSQSGSVSKDYEIRVNVHQVKADSLAWFAMESAPMPATIAKPTAQRTVLYADTYYCLTGAPSGYSLATTKNPSAPDWTSAEVDFPFTPDVNSLSATSEALYILADDGTLYTSTDFATWTSTSQSWTHIYGAYGTELLGCAENSGRFEICSYPALARIQAPDGFPVSGTSQLISFTLPMGESSTALMVGGRCPDGSLTADTWAYDGTSWAKISNKPLPLQLSDMTLLSYALINVPSSTWTPVEYPVLLAMGGRVTNGAVNRTVYYSRDWGMTWKVAPDLVQLPKQVPAFYGATGYTFTSVMTETSRSAYWNEIAVRTLYPGCSWMDDTANSRAVYPVTEWKSPAIYVFGGYNPDGEVLNSLWRGIVMQYTFKPVE